MREQHKIPRMKTMPTVAQAAAHPRAGKSKANESTVTTRLKPWRVITELDKIKQGQLNLVRVTT